MDFLVTIDDSKAAFFLELMKNLRTVRTKPLTPEKAAILEGIRDAVEEVKLAKQGKIKLKPARELLREL
ncbi:MAG TPA: hypothetical protein VGM92_11685 [Candidatus Kapabacteria bacterium]|jgi:hypothetical protein